MFYQFLGIGLNFQYNKNTLLSLFCVMIMFKIMFNRIISIKRNLVTYSILSKNSISNLV